MTADAIRVTNLKKSYPGFSLGELSFSLPKGQVMGFIGENGAGKTTAIKCLLGLTQPEAGQISLLGQRLPQAFPSVKQETGVVLSQPGLHDSLNIKCMGAVFKRAYLHWDEKLFQQYIRAFQLPEKKPFREYSTGMLRKASIALALSHHPKLLILDEPTSGLDPVVREEILDLFLDFMQDEDHAILFSSHITSDLDKIADSLTFLHEGKLVFSKDRNELQEKLGVCQLPASALEQIPKELVLRVRRHQFGCQALVKDRRLFRELCPEYPAERSSTEEIMLFYIKGQPL